MEQKQTKDKYSNEINRVNEYFSKILKKFQIKNNNSQNTKEFAASHTYLLIKSLKALYALNALASSSRRFGRQPLKITSSKEEALPKRYFPAGIEGGSFIDLNFTPNRVRGWRLKECNLAKDQMERLRKSSASPKRRDIALFVEKDAFQEDLEQAEEWRKLIEPQEERHFRITRITEVFTK